MFRRSLATQLGRGPAPHTPIGERAPRAIR
jgi:hypothetical protein